MFYFWMFYFWLASACVLRNKMTCAMELDYSEEEVRSVIRIQLCPEARHRSRRLELGLDAVDDCNIFSALSRSACSTTCCCIAFRNVESGDFFRSVYRNSLCISGLGRHTGFILE